MTQEELKIKLNDIINLKQRQYDAYEEINDGDLTVKEIMSRIDAAKTAFIAVLDSLNGDSYLIDSY